MRTQHRGHSIDRRLVLAGGAALFGGVSTAGWAQPAAPNESRKLSARIADFARGFDLAKAPPLGSKSSRRADRDSRALA